MNKNYFHSTNQWEYLTTKKSKKKKTQRNVLGKPTRRSVSTENWFNFFFQKCRLVRWYCVTRWFIIVYFFFFFDRFFNSSAPKTTETPTGCLRSRAFVPRQRLLLPPTTPRDSRVRHGRKWRGGGVAHDVHTASWVKTFRMRR